MFSSSTSQNNTIAGVAAFCIFLSIPPYFLWHSPLVAIFSVLAGLLIMVLCVNNKTNQRKPSPPASLLLTLTYIWLCLINNDNIFGVFVTVAIIPLFYAPEDSVKTIYTTFVKIVSFFLAISLSIYFLVTILGIDLPHTVIEPLNEGKEEVIYRYFMMVKKDVLISGYRFYGIFDEPGVIGTIAAVILIIERFYLKKWQNIVLFVSGVFSFSLTFYAMAFFYLLLALPAKKRIFLILGIVVIVVISYNNETVYELLYRRLEITESGGVYGYNRTSKDFEDYYNSFLHSSDIWFGRGAGISAIYDEGGASYKHLIVNYGLVFFFFYLLAWFIYCIRKRRSFLKIALSFVVIGTILYQRPFISNWLYVFLMVLVPNCVEDNRKKLIDK